MANFEIHEYPDNVPQRRFTFTVDGALSFKWFPTRVAAERCVNRLKAGLSGEAFGGAGVATVAGKQVSDVEYAAADGNGKKARAKIASAGEVTTEEVETKSGRKKPRERKPGFVIEVDSKVFEGGTDLKQVKADAATAAFMTRGKLGVQEEASAAFKDLTGKLCKVHLIGQKLVAKDQDGGLWWVGVNVNAPLTKKYTFKPLAGQGQVKLGSDLGGISLRAKQ